MVGRVRLWVIVSVVLLGGCGGSAGESADPTPSAFTVGDTAVTTMAAEPETTTTTEAALEFERLDFRGGLPITVTYKALDWTVEEAWISNQDHSPIAQPGDPIEDYSATIELSVASSFEEALVKFDPNDLFRLDLGDGRLLDPISRIETDLAPSDSVYAGETGSISLDFAAPRDTDLSQATLVVGETGLIPTEVPLAGPEPSSPYPIELDIDIAEDIVLEAGCFTDPAQLEITGGRLDVDITVDEDDVLNVSLDNDSVTSVPRRAPIGSRFVELDLRIGTESAGACGGSLVGADDFVVEVDGELRTHDWDPGVYSSVNLKSGDSIEFGIGYTVPDDLDTLTLLAGYRSGEPLRIEIALPLVP